MDFHRELLRKTVSAEEAVFHIPDHSKIYTYGLAEPAELISKLPLLKGVRQDLVFIDFLNAYPYDFYTDPSLWEMVRSESFFFGRACREAQKIGGVSFVPNHLSQSVQDKLVYGERREKTKTVYTLMVSPMDAHGYFSTGIVGLSNRTLVEQADVVILEINENMPRTFGNTFIHISEVDCVYHGGNKMPYLEPREGTEEDRLIGEYVADLIEDESTIQLGIGSIPGAVAEALKSKHDLGIHTEMLSDSIVELCRAGVVTNRKKTLHEGLIVTTFSYGSKAAYDFIHENPRVRHMSVEYVNDPSVIRKNRKMASVNTTLECDLMGQCASEAVGTYQLSGTGGQSETASGARQSPGGKSIVALHSTVMVRDGKGGRERRSTIVGVHPAGTVISLLRADVDYVVTEYGVASLRGASLAERARELIGIAHPDYREQLRDEAKRYHLL